ncbi:MAG: hypothetical protein SCARUB_04480 [Candidatus Scalindua rubra]|uniref:Uncharacterized protein n=1 Tax=Candidatus Scalindua rubra TaxID=1872076 RepID=A0A1E3X465_9BACT|nr:MAG: hypothetical protein SCARUB_04480 [Candidatus Scalindua rubra]
MCVYMSKKPRNDLTSGITLLLGAIGRVCMPTSKRAWWNWAKTTTCEYLLRRSLSKIDSQHFWDLMDALPVEAIGQIRKSRYIFLFAYLGISLPQSCGVKQEQRHTLNRDFYAYKKPSKSYSKSNTRVLFSHHGILISSKELTHSIITGL